MKEILEKSIDDLTEVIKERVFKPMYFYFIISWTIINWKFVYVLLFENEKIIVEHAKILKVDYLAGLYKVGTMPEIFNTSLSLVILPFVSSFVFVWWLSRLSKIFFIANEEHKASVVTAKKIVILKEEFKLENEMKETREDAEKLAKIEYKINQNFNQDFDSSSEEISILGIDIPPSKALYENDYDVYVAALDDFKNRPVENE